MVDKKLVEEIKKIIEEPITEHILIVYPAKNTKRFPKGDTYIDFVTGLIEFADHTTDKLARYLKGTDFGYIRSISVEPDSDIIVGIERNGVMHRFFVEAKESRPINYTLSERLLISCDTDTEIRLVASTHPEGVPTRLHVVSPQPYITLKPTLLGIGGEYKSAGFDTIDYGDIAVEIYSDAPSATDGVRIQTSNTDEDTEFKDIFRDTYTGGEPIYSKVFSVTNKYMRIKYINGATAQTKFKITIVRKMRG